MYDDDDPPKRHSDIPRNVPWSWVVESEPITASERNAGRPPLAAYSPAELGKLARQDAKADKAFARLTPAVLAPKAPRATSANGRPVRKSRACLDCGVCVYELGEYAYILHDPVWQSFGGFRSDHVLLCVGCLETRLWRPLHCGDFNWRVPLNYVPWDRSDRLQARMRAPPPQ